MEQNSWLAEQFEASRAHLEAVAYRMLGSRVEAEDAVQEAWLRLARADTRDVANLGGWLTTVVARVCLDALRARRARDESSLDDHADATLANREDRPDPEREAVLADSVGVALLVVLERLTPAERVAFVLHDMFDLSFDEIAPIIGRSSEATRQLASRGRRRVRGSGSDEGRVSADRARQRDIARAYLDASRSGDLASLLAVLDPEVALRVDAAALPVGAPTEVRGASAVAGRALAYGHRARYTRVALVEGRPGLVIAPSGRLSGALVLTFAGDHIVGIELIAQPERLRALDIATLDV